MTKTCCTPARIGARADAPAPEDLPFGAGPKGARARIPGGAGLLGTKHALLPVDGEAPLRKTKHKAFEMELETVSHARFAAFVAETGYVTEAERLGDSFVFHTHLPLDVAEASMGVAAAPWWRVIKGASWAAPFGPHDTRAPDPGHPVTHVTWNDARAFARWVGGRLPTEAEWEHAARGGLGDVRYPWGDEDPSDTGPYPCNIWQGPFPHSDSAADGYAGTAPVRSFAPNGYGLYNMVGNVWEWTADPFKVRSLKKTVQAAHAGKQGWKVSKGGSFLCHLSYCYRYRIAARSGNSPDSSTAHQGIRVVYDLA